QAYITNRCGFRQCKSGKNRLFYSADLEQVVRVSVHCKLVTRATQFVVYRHRRASVKGSLYSVSDQMRGIETSGLNGADCWSDQILSIRRRFLK
ncbi:MAG TPA: hypothetical protein DIT97_31050, partial [Gimesia maris]|nr:hypothetical protein [Gimesia maris]